MGTKTKKIKKVLWVFMKRFLARGLKFIAKKFRIFLSASDSCKVWVGRRGNSKGAADLVNVIRLPLLYRKVWI
jgi:hypothetical protein